MMLKTILADIIKTLFREFEFEFCKNKERLRQHKLEYKFYKIITYQRLQFVFVIDPFDCMFMP